MKEFLDLLTGWECVLQQKQVILMVNRIQNCGKKEEKKEQQFFRNNICIRFYFIEILFDWLQ